MSRIRKRQPAVAVTPYVRAPAQFHERNQIGFGPYADAYPLTSSADVAAIRQAERSRDELLGADPEWWTGE